jgi:hypothetical protein
MPIPPPTKSTVGQRAITRLATTTGKQTIKQTIKSLGVVTIVLLVLGDLWLPG